MGKGREGEREKDGIGRDENWRDRERGGWRDREKETSAERSKRKGWRQRKGGS